MCGDCERSTPKLQRGWGSIVTAQRPILQWGRGSNRAICGDCERPTPKAQVAVGLGFHCDRPAPILQWGRGSNRAIASARRPSTPYGFWGTKIIGGGIIVRQRYTYPNSEVCAARNTPAIMSFCRRGAVAGRA